MSLVWSDTDAGDLAQLTRLFLLGRRIDENEVAGYIKLATMSCKRLSA